MKNKLNLILILLALAVAIGLIAYPKLKQRSDVSLDGFAQCLADKGATMYGAAWCSHCQREKAAFGGSWRLVPYVECPENTKLCVDKGIKGYPTWIFDDGRRFEGEQGIKKLSEVSGCPLPEGR
ncbi:MAG: hypothetical protein HZA81_01190 [Candidatus Taylorbacteria bacterium]|nr:hypothetical protein [Candidatus Taylorbacteria bacterium]